MLADAHCHLDEIENLSECIKRAKLAGVDLILTNSVDLESMKKNLKISKKYKEVKCAFALHPNEIASMQADEIEEAFSFIEKNSSECIAIGETGLDFKYANAQQKEMQCNIFARHIELAKNIDKALIVHSRAARKECIEILELQNAKKVLMHWFIAEEKLLRKALDLGYFVSIGPSVLFQKHVQEFARKVPLENLLLETDSPVSYNAHNAEPSWIKAVAEKISELFGISRAHLEEQTWENFQRLFSKA